MTNRRVIVLLETSLSVSREMLRGIHRYARGQGGWIVEQVYGGVGDMYLPEGWRGDGIISRALVPRQMDRVLAHPAPKVLMDVPLRYLSGRGETGSVVRFESDYVQTGRDAADYFLARGFRHFAFFGETRSSVARSAWTTAQAAVPEWSALRGRGFCERILASGYEVTDVSSVRSTRESQNWNLERPRLVKLLRELPKPLAVFTPNDARGRQILDACREGGIAVPYAVAVLGVNDDGTICETVDAALSSIPLCAEEAGYDAAAALDRLMRGGRVPKLPQVYGHRPVVTRESTLRLQTDDPLVIAALCRIREREGFNLRANELAAECGVSLRTLDNHFVRELGRSVGSVLRETCLNGVRRLVTSTDLPFKAIAARAGHLSAAHLADAYRRRFGVTMTDDRTRGDASEKR